MAVAIPFPKQQPGTPTPNSLASPDNGVDSVVNPNLGFAQQLQGAAAAAAQPMPARPITVAPAPFDPNAPTAPGMPGTNAAAGAVAPGASGFHRFIDSAMGKYTVGRNVDAVTTQLGQPTSPFARLANFVGGDDATKAAMDQHDQIAQFYGKPEVQGHLRANPGDIALATAQPGPYAKALQAVMDLHAANAGTPPATTSQGVPLSDPAKTAQHAAEAGVHTDVASHFTDPHQYSEDEFVNNLRGKLNWGQAAKLWQMQHYVPPAQQAAGQYLGLLAAQSDQAQHALANAPANLAKGELDKLKKAASDAAVAHEQGIRAMGVGANLYAAPTPLDPAASQGY